ncbi:hypothetical protein [Latilactobacillus phage TMW 1.1447 P1]|uniref:hypothetical protein n=1 Tax=Latilactobacillus curvatus TaxID=28038 RepID=UPI0024100EA3|nr:hypothetical protein [Latilactobacillus curvatus]MDG2982576.1 hypothetical protein [Latilactobacillus curvatus]WEU69739.1 hypothetical protein [Latilactobacillus phage TMW 1.1447 P1]
MDEKEILIRISQNLKKTEDLEYKRALLYSAYSTLLLSTNIFKLNIDIANFLTPLFKLLDEKYPKKNTQSSYVFKDYVYRSRSLIVARFMRIIQTSTDDAGTFLEKTFTEFVSLNYSSNKKQSPQPSKPRRNSVDDLFERFKR